MGILLEGLGEQPRGTNTQRYRSSSGEDSSGKQNGLQRKGQKWGNCEMVCTSTECEAFLTLFVFHEIVQKITTTAAPSIMSVTMFVTCLNTQHSNCSPDMV